MAISTKFLQLNSFRMFFTVCCCVGFISFSNADDIHCPNIANGMYPNKFQLPGDETTLWTLNTPDQDFVIIRNEVTWQKLSVVKTDDTLQLTCQGLVNGSDKIIQVECPIYFAPPRFCTVNPLGNYFNCSMQK